MADRTRRNPAAKLPIASHPLFPVIVVLWFGALFGLASLAIRPAFLEGIVSATGIDHVIPKAAPPLGTTTRILIALMMTGLGCVAGLFVAKRFASSAAAPAVRRRRPAPVVDTVSPVSLFGRDRQDAEADDEFEAAPKRRRQLAIMAEDQDDDIYEPAPIPGSAQILNVAELDLGGYDDQQEAWLQSTTRREVASGQVISDWDEDDSVAFEDINDLAFEVPVDDAPVPTAGTRFDAFQQVAREMTAGEPEASDHKRSNRLFESYVRRVNAGIGSNDSDGVPAPGFVSLPEVDGEADQLAEPVDSVEAPVIVEELVAEEPVAEEQESSPYANAAERIAAAPLDELSHVELLERLGQTIARRRAEWVEAAERKAQVEAVEPEPALDAQSAAAEPAEVPAPEHADIPAALRPQWDTEASDDEALPGYVPPRHIAFKPIAAVQADEDVLAQGYSSLLGMTKPAARTEAPELAAAPPPPVYAFPGLKDVASGEAPSEPAPRAFDPPPATSPAPDATEQALLAALATLKRMSGAA